MSTPNDPHLGDTLPTSRAGRVDPQVGEAQGGPSSHERPAFSDPIVESTSDRGTAADRVPGAASTTPDAREGRDARAPGDSGDFEDRAAANNRANADDAPMRGAGTPVRRVGEDAEAR